MPAVSVLPGDGEGRILLRQHDGFGAWGLIGGTLHLDESPWDGVRRKAAEVGIEVDGLSLVDVYGGPEYRITYPNGDELAIVGSVFAAALAGPLSDSVQWFTTDNLAAIPLVGLTRAILRGQRLITE